ncbi:MAG: excinuclease ABC subunit UvrB, partial [Eubacteriales bacterium]|nr:excinuclease ABC subunit UvrB [Eubacteriales bacterium]
MNRFQVVSPFEAQGDQPQAIERLVAGVNRGERGQILLGVTGSGKTFTMAKVIEQLNRPTLVIAHNKTLAGQLCAEFKSFFPHNAVEYFVSYYDYYQPEAYIPGTDTFIEKDAAINDEIDRLRHSATASLIERRDVIVVSSVSCIYGLGEPADYKDLMIHLREGQRIDRDELLERLVKIQYMRNDFVPKRGNFSVKGDIVDIYPSAYEKTFVRVSFFDDEVERLLEIDCLTKKTLAARSYIGITPASHYAVNDEKTQRAIDSIEAELEERLEYFRQQGKLVEAYRLEQRTRYDIEMLRETGFCKGIENYSRHLDGRSPGEAPYTLLDFFPDDFLLMVDESHVTIPQIGAMYHGDHSRKKSLIDFGFRLPSAFDNRPLNFEEFEARMGQTFYVSATPAKYEREHAGDVVEQVIRPTGLLDPEIEIHPSEGQIDYLLELIETCRQRDERVLVLTLTKKSS